MPRAAAPLMRRSRGGGRRRSRGGGRSGLVTAVLGAAALGYIEKADIKVPTIPVLGRAGTLGAAAWWFSRSGGGPRWLHDVAVGMLAVAAHQLVKEGEIAGDEGTV